MIVLLCWTRRPDDCFVSCNIIYLFIMFLDIEVSCKIFTVITVSRWEPKISITSSVSDPWNMVTIFTELALMPLNNSQKSVYFKFFFQNYDVRVKLTFDLFEINCLHSTISDICGTFCPYHRMNSRVLWQWPWLLTFDLWNHVYWWSWKELPYNEIIQWLLEYSDSHRFSMLEKPVCNYTH